MEQILIIEDSTTMAQVASNLVKSELGYVTTITASLAETQQLLAMGGERFLAALVDLTLPDSSDGEIVDYVISMGIPAIVITASFDEKRREAILKKHIVDYVIKDNRNAYNYVIRLLARLDRNRQIKALVVDDSSTARNMIRVLLLHHNFQVLVAEDGADALRVLKQNPDVKLVITDYNMPEMDGFALTAKIRQQYPRDGIAIIGLSAQGSGEMSARFLKNGANDFLTKPFSQEEFYCRVMQNVETIEHIETIRDAANRDYLTSLYNRRYFFEVGSGLFNDAKRGGGHLVVAMMDVDFFKKVNDNYGHDGGDVVLKHMAVLINEAFAAHLPARFGGEEFAVMFQGLDADEVDELLNDFRRRVEGTSVPFGDQQIRFTLSIGYTDKLGNSVDDALALADAGLYAAKEGGRNQVVYR
jgi:diguanylate cyclase (GGDEF)-like protein